MGVFFGPPSTLFSKRLLNWASATCTTAPRQKNHLNPFLSILNGKAVENLQSFHKLDYNIAMSKLRPSVVGQRWNFQHTWGVATLNIRRNNPHDLVNRPTLKKENVMDGILPQFVALSELLLEVDKNHDFYCGLMVGNKQRVDHAHV
jgi:hypothetical protein